MSISEDVSSHVLEAAKSTENNVQCRDCLYEKALAFSDYNAKGARALLGKHPQLQVNCSPLISLSVFASRGEPHQKINGCSVAG